MRVSQGRWFRLAIAAGVLWLAFYGTWLAFGPSSPHARMVFGDTAYDVPIAAAAALAAVAWRRSERESRIFWGLVALSNVLWLAGEVLWSVRELGSGSVPFPWWTDVGYLTSYVLLIPALLRARRPSLRAERLAPFLDALLVTGGLVLLWWLVVLRPLTIAADLGSLVGLAYPLLGLILLGLLIALELLPARRLRITFVLFSAAVASTAVTDGLYTHAVITHTYLSGAWLDLGWQLEAVLLALAAVAAIARVDRTRDEQLLRRPRRLSPLAVVSGALLLVLAGLITEGSADHLTVGVAAAATFLATLAVVRVGVALRSAARRGELHEPETGLYRSEYFFDQLRCRLIQLRYYGDPFAVALVGCDNPAAGRAAYDELARRMHEASRELDSVCRLDDETLVLLLPGVEAEQALALADHLRLVGSATDRTTVSIGVAAVAEPAGEDEILERAEAALKASRTLGGNQVRGAPDDLTLFADGRLDGERLELLSSFARMVDRRENDFGDEASCVASLAEALAFKLGLDPEVAERARIAGLLHDLGKIALPEQLLRKAGPLDDDEWTRLVGHTSRGADIADSVAAVRRIAPAIAAHHERWDGGGYPRSLAREEIPLEARIVAVADAYISMRSPRAYRSSLGAVNAMKEVFLQSGKQFDPTVVNAFFDLVSDRSLDEIIGALAELPALAADDDI